MVFADGEVHVALTQYNKLYMCHVTSHRRQTIIWSGNVPFECGIIKCTNHFFPHSDFHKKQRDFSLQTNVEPRSVAFLREFDLSLKTYFKQMLPL